MEPKAIIKGTGLFGAGILAALTMQTGDIDYKDVEVKQQTTLYEDCHGMDGTDPSKVTTVVKIVDINDVEHEVRVPKIDVKEDK